MNFMKNLKKAEKRRKQKEKPQGQWNSTINGIPQYGAENERRQKRNHFDNQVRSVLLDQNNRCGIDEFMTAFCQMHNTLPQHPSYWTKVPWGVSIQNGLMTLAPKPPESAQQPKSARKLKRIAVYEAKQSAQLSAQTSAQTAKRDIKKLFRDQVVEFLENCENGRMKIVEFRSKFNDKYGNLPAHPNDAKAWLNHFPKDFYYCTRDRSVVIVDFDFPVFAVTVKPKSDSNEEQGEDKASKFKAMFVEFLSLCPEKRVLAKRLLDEIKIDGTHSVFELADVSTLTGLYSLTEDYTFKDGPWLKLKFSTEFRENRDSLKKKVVEILGKCQDKTMFESELWEQARLELGAASISYEQIGVVNLECLFRKWGDTVSSENGIVSLKEELLQTAQGSQQAPGTERCTSQPNCQTGKNQKMRKPTKSKFRFVSEDSSIKASRPALHRRKSLGVLCVNMLSIHKKIEKDKFWDTLRKTYPKLHLWKSNSWKMCIWKMYEISDMNELFYIFRDILKVDETETWVTLNEEAIDEDFLNQMFLLLEKHNGVLKNGELQQAYFAEYGRDLPHDIVNCHKIVTLNCKSRIKWRKPNGTIMLQNYTTLNDDCSGPAKPHDVQSIMQMRFGEKKESTNMRASASVNQEYLNLNSRTPVQQHGLMWSIVMERRNKRKAARLRQKQLLLQKMNKTENGANQEYLNYNLNYNYNNHIPSTIKSQEFMTGNDAAVENNLHSLYKAHQSQSQQEKYLPYVESQTQSLQKLQLQHNVYEDEDVNFTKDIFKRETACHPSDLHTSQDGHSGRVTTMGEGFASSEDIMWRMAQQSVVHSDGEKKNAPKLVEKQMFMHQSTASMPNPNIGPRNQFTTRSGTLKRPFQLLSPRVDHRDDNKLRKIEKSQERTDESSIEKRLRDVYKSYRKETQIEPRFTKENPKESAIHGGIPKKPTYKEIQRDLKYKEERLQNHPCNRNTGQIEQNQKHKKQMKPIQEKTGFRVNRLDKPVYKIERKRQHNFKEERLVEPNYRKELQIKPNLREERQREPFFRGLTLSQDKHQEHIARGERQQEPNYIEEKQRESHVSEERQSESHFSEERHRDSYFSEERQRESHPSDNRPQESHFSEMRQREPSIRAREERQRESLQRGERQRETIHREDRQRESHFSGERRREPVYRKERHRGSLHKEETREEPFYIEHRQNEPIYRENQQGEPLYREEPDYRESIHREDRPRAPDYRESSYIEDMPREPIYREERERDPIHREDRQREPSFIKESPREHIYRDEREREPNSRGEREREPIYREERPRDPIHREDWEREPIYREERPRDRIHKEGRQREPIYREERPRDPIHREDRQREPSYIEENPREPIYRDEREREPNCRAERQREPIYREDRHKEPNHREERQREPVYREDRHREPIYREDRPKEHSYQEARRIEPRYRERR